MPLYLRLWRREQLLDIVVLVLNSIFNTTRNIPRIVLRPPIMSTVTVTMSALAQQHEPAMFATLSPPTKHNISTSLQYVKLSQAGEALGPSTWGKTDFEEDREELVPVVVQDIRGNENQYTLDTHGFQLVKHKSTISKEDFTEGTNIENIYYAETAEVVKRV